MEVEMQDGTGSSGGSPGLYTSGPLIHPGFRFQLRLPYGVAFPPLPRETETSGVG